MSTNQQIFNGQDIVFLLDFDNTVFDNDRFIVDLDARLERDFGVAGRKRYREHYAAIRDETGYADYLAPVQKLRSDVDDDTCLLHLAAFILDYPFAGRLYPQALAAVAHLGSLGTPAIVSDGDMVLQPRKVQRSGLWDAVGGRVAICLHKQERLDAIQRRWPARHYVMVEDKQTILVDMKREMGTKLTTIFVRQGHYAQEERTAPGDPAPDIVIDHIGELCSLGLDEFLTAAGNQDFQQSEQP